MNDRAMFTPNSEGIGGDVDDTPAPVSAAEAEQYARTAVANDLHRTPPRFLAALLAEVDRLRARTHEIQAQEMAKRAALDSEIAEWRARYEQAKQWTEQAGLTAEWVSSSAGYHPFWSMTSHNMRSTLLRLVTERDEARAALASSRERWACWFEETAAHADDITDGEAAGLRLAAVHLRNAHIAEQVALINLGPAVEVVRPAAPQIDRTTSPEETS